MYVLCGCGYRGWVVVQGCWVDGCVCVYEVKFIPSVTKTNFKIAKPLSVIISTNVVSY